MPTDAVAAEEPLPVWRSLLYVPANQPRFIGKAHTRGADGIILDLEDSVPAASREPARRALADSVAGVGRSGADVLVRINASGDDLGADLDAACIAGVKALVVPKAESAVSIRALSERVSNLETSRQLAPGAISFFLLIETAAGFFEARNVAQADPRVVALSLGSEDFSLAAGMAPEPDNLFMPKQWTLLAARAAGIVPLGLVGSVAGYADLDAMKTAALRSRALGFEGASCIHPDVVPVLNEAFTPSEAEIASARRIVDAYNHAVDAGVGAVTVDGRMIDAPVALRAKRLLERSLAIANRPGA